MITWPKLVQENFLRDVHPSILFFTRLLYHSQRSAISVFPLAAEQAVENHIVALAVAAEMLAVDPFTGEAKGFVQLDGRRVVAKNGQADTVQVKFVEGEFEGNLHGVTAVSLPSIFFIANGNADESCAVRPHDAIHLQQAEKIVAG